MVILIRAYGDIIGVALDLTDNGKVYYSTKMELGKIQVTLQQAQMASH